MRLSGFIRMLKRKKGECVYDKNICSICSQICYNRKDLEMHVKKNHILTTKDKIGKEEASMEI